MLKKVFRELLLSILEALAIVLFLFVFLWPLEIDGGSMEPTLYSDERIVVSRAYKLFNDFSYGDLVICKINDNGEQQTIVKRVIAVPGDVISISLGNVYINNRLLKEDYVYSNAEFTLDDTILSEDEYFIMGDNRSISYDSRNIGPIQKDDIVGLVILKWYPFNKLFIF